MLTHAYVPGIKVGAGVVGCGVGLADGLVVGVWLGVKVGNQVADSMEGKVLQESKCTIYKNAAVNTYMSFQTYGNKCIT